ncbi:MAG TPA: UDP-N-acetylmuramate dehydrogenase [Streptosporangiaceae bacterium]|jgi:UDP-N-acetylmuramate dehydrogenase|nr:UDP-N-acetylmuramate dehydrogenase [Streptosporangiaceae bacterium]
MAAPGNSASLADYTTLRLGGPARALVTAATDDDLIGQVRAADTAGEPLLVLGGGSNLVVADEGFPGTVVHVATTGIDRAGDAGLTVAAGEDWDAVVAGCVDDGLAGLECLSGIPGRAGATPIQNVGAYGQEVAGAITSVRVYDRADGQVRELAAAQCGFGYRTSAFKRSLGAGEVTGRFVVLGVTFALVADKLSMPVSYPELARTLGVDHGGRAPLAEVRAAVLELRRGKGMVLDPGDPDTRSVGSFFVNPVLAAGRYAALERAAGPGVPHYPAAGGKVKVPAAWLIEQAGFGKGYRHPAGARISAKHTLALVNPGSASTASLLALAREIRNGVREAFGVELASEPVLVGAQL